jgi:hypothetical protein
MTNAFRDKPSFASMPLRTSLFAPLSSRKPPFALSLSKGEPGLLHSSLAHRQGEQSLEVMR